MAASFFARVIPKKVRGAAVAGTPKRLSIVSRAYASVNHPAALRTPRFIFGTTPPAKNAHMPVFGSGFLNDTIGRAIREIPFWRHFALKRLSRSQYKQVWNFVSQSAGEAKRAVSQSEDENSHSESAKFTLAYLQKYVGVGKNDVVLEIGAGFGRMGGVLAPLCREWIGTDVSENMVQHMRDRLAQYANIRTMVSNGYDLAGIPSGSVDMVYCTVVFMHLEEWERYGYIKEGFRILKPGGRMLVDNVNLLSELGWKFFENLCAIPPAKRPPHISKTSTPQEQEIYFRRAGFDRIQQAQFDLWIVTYGVKPDAASIPH